MCFAFPAACWSLDMRVREATIETVLCKRCGEVYSVHVFMKSESEFFLRVCSNASNT